MSGLTVLGFSCCQPAMLWLCSEGVAKKKKVTRHLCPFRTVLPLLMGLVWARGVQRVIPEVLSAAAASKGKRLWHQVAGLSFQFIF